MLCINIINVKWIKQPNPGFFTSSFFLQTTAKTLVWLSVSCDRRKWPSRTESILLKENVSIVTRPRLSTCDSTSEVHSIGACTWCFLCASEEPQTKGPQGWSAWWRDHQGRTGDTCRNNVHFYLIRLFNCNHKRVCAWSGYWRWSIE